MHPSHGTNPPPHRHNKKTIITIFTYLIILFCTGYFDLFGIKSASAKASSDLFQRIISGINYSSISQPKVSVFLINDEYLTSRRLHWPLDYSTQLKIISEILSKNPKAIYLDLLYMHPHGSDAEIEEFIKNVRLMAKEHGNTPIVIPMLMAGQGFDCTVDYRQREDIQADADSLLPAFTESFFTKAHIGWTKCGSQYPLLLSGSSRYISPALTLYNIYCNNDSINCGEQYTKQGYPSRWREQFRQPMVVQWGVNSSLDSVELLSGLGTRCQTPAITFTEKLGYIAAQTTALFTQMLTGNPNRGQRAKCTYADTFYAQWLVGIPQWMDKIFTEIVEDRIVLVGASTAANPNWVSNPINGKIPGVFLHAMALDNLITFGTQYIKQMPSSLLVLVEIAALFILIVFMRLLAGLLINRNNYSLPIINHCYIISRIVFIIIIYCLLPLLLVTVIASLCVYWGYAPINWVGIATAATATELSLQYKQIKQCLFKPIT